MICWLSMVDQSRPEGVSKFVGIALVEFEEGECPSCVAKSLSLIPDNVTEVMPSIVDRADIGDMPLNEFISSDDFHAKYRHLAVRNGDVRKNVN